MGDQARLIRMHPSDNVAIVANDGGLPEGAQIDGLTLRQPVPQAHKLALRELAAGDPVRRYGVVIGFAKGPIPAGGWVNESSLDMPQAPDLDRLSMAREAPAEIEPLEGYTFQGFRNADGSVGTRNILAITNTVQCVSGIVGHAVERLRREVMPRFPNVDDVVALDHTYGCGVAIEAPGAAVPIRTLHNISRNPNFAGSTMVVSLGCEKLQPTLLFPEAFGAGQGAPPSLVTLQDESHVGFEAMQRSILETAEKHLARLDTRRRETCPASDLVVGVQCGGSDALSGVTANPALGHAADLIVRAGGTVMFSEVTEVRDGIDQLVRRAASDDVASDLIAEMAWYDAYLARGQSDRSANTTPGNKKGGLSRLPLAGVERLAAGCRWCEGPVWFGDGRYLLWSDIPNNRIMRWDEVTGQVSAFREPSIFANGQTRDRQGRLVTCEHGGRRVTRTEYDGTITVLADGYDGKRLNSPNDVVVKSDGSTWFSDPPFGIAGNYEGHRSTPELGQNVYRLDPMTGRLSVVADDILGPNGLAFSPDEATLYIVESRGVPSRKILAYDVGEEGASLANKRVLIDAGPGTPDGFRVDVDGNLWCGWGMGSEALDGVMVFAPDGVPIGRIALPERCANVCFGGRANSRLFMAASRSVYSLYVNVAGVAGG